MSGIGKTRRGAYHVRRVLGDVQTVARSVRSGSRAPIARRIVRRTAWRTVGKLMRRSGI